MPVQSVDNIQTMAVGIEFTQIYQSWIISSGVVVHSEQNYAVTMFSNYNNIYNNGMVVSQNQWGINSNGEFNRIINNSTGVIAGTSGVVSTGLASEIINQGFIHGTFFDGVTIAGDYAKVTNHGAIAGYDGIGVNSILTQAIIVNNGSIDALDEGIRCSSVSVEGLAGTLFIYNNGAINAPVAIRSQNDVFLANRGTIDGVISLSDAADYFKNTGSVFGQTDLWGGDDIFDSRGGSTEGWLVNGGAGKDTLLGGSVDDSFTGGDDNDVLKGFLGDDLLTGGKGADTLLGGRGADTFVITSKADSGLNASNRDVIRDFSTNEGDVIDLGFMDANTVTAGNQAFVFIGTGAFTGAAGELRYELVAGGNAILYGNIDSNAGADFSIYLSNVASLSSADFLL